MQNCDICRENKAPHEQKFECGCVQSVCVDCKISDKVTIKLICNMCVSERILDSAKKIPKYKTYEP